MTFQEAFDKYIKGQKATGTCEVKLTYSYYPGIVFENGYKYVSHGGNASGYDYNEYIILDTDNNIVAQEETTN
jgi:hypothetical protein